MYEARFKFFRVRSWPTVVSVSGTSGKITSDICMTYFFSIRHFIFLSKYGQLDLLPARVLRLKKTPIAFFSRITFLLFLALSCSFLLFLALSCSFLLFLALSCSFLLFLALSCSSVLYLDRAKSQNILGIRKRSFVLFSDFASYLSTYYSMRFSNHVSFFYLLYCGYEEINF